MISQNKERSLLGLCSSNQISTCREVPGTHLLPEWDPSLWEEEFGEILSASENSKTGHMLIVVGVAANSHDEFLLLKMCLNCSSSCHSVVFENWEMVWGINLRADRIPRFFSEAHEFSWVPVSHLRPGQQLLCVNSSKTHINYYSHFDFWNWVVS